MVRGDFSRVGQYLKGLPILYNSNTVIFAIGNCGEPGEILEGIRLASCESWSNTEQYEKEGSRELFLQWALEQTRPVFFAFTEKKRPIVHTLHSSMKYAGEFGVEDYHEGEVVVFVRDLT